MMLGNKQRIVTLKYGFCLFEKDSLNILLKILTKYFKKIYYAKIVEIQ